MQTESQMLPKGEATFKVTRPDGRVELYAPSIRVKLPLRHRLKLLRQTIQIGLVKRVGKLLGVPTITSELRLRKFDAKRGVFLDYGVVARRLITDAGVEFLVDDWDTDAQDITTMNFHGYGTGVAAEDVTDVALGTEVETPRGAGTKTQPNPEDLRTVQTHQFSGTFAITEHGIFSATTAGTLWDRSQFSAINVDSGDSIEATYTCTINSGG